MKGGRCVWAANTSDARALTGPNGLTRTAAGYCDPTETADQADVPRSLQREPAPLCGGVGRGRIERKRDHHRRHSPKPAFRTTWTWEATVFEEGQWAIFPISEQAGGSLTITVSGDCCPTRPSSRESSSATHPPRAAFSGSHKPPQGSVDRRGSARKGYDLADWDGVVRRQLTCQTPRSEPPCRAAATSGPHRPKTRGRCRALTASRARRPPTTTRMRSSCS